MTQKPTYYRSIDQLDHPDAWKELLRREFPDVDPDVLPPVSRRRFIQLLGASAALAAAGGCRWEKEKILPFNERPDGRVPGVPQHFATTMEVAGCALPLLMTCFDGRPVKAEGNPDHPLSLGATTVYGQASVLELYDPDRSRLAHMAGGFMKADDAFVRLRAVFDDLRRARGAGVYVLAEPTSSPTITDLRRRFAEALPDGSWHEYDPVSDDEAREGSRIAFGAEVRAILDLSQADVIVSLDADLFGEHPSALRHSRDFARRRTPELGPMTRLYAVESAFTPTGAAADHRLPLRSSLIGGVAETMDAKLRGAASPEAGTPVVSNARLTKFVEEMTKDLHAHPGRCVVVAGRSQPAAVHARVHSLNAVLGNVGTTVRYVRVPDAEAAPSGHVRSLRALVEAMNRGAVKTLLILGGNPVYDAPADLEFAAALAKVEQSIHLSRYRDETSLRCSVHVPRAHYLETWGDARADDGTLTIAQPTVEPLHGGKSAIEMLALLLDEDVPAYELVKRSFAARAGDDELTWRRAVRDGFVAGSGFADATPEVARDLPKLRAGDGADQPLNGSIELCFRPDSKTWDGRFANSGWLQELPDFMTKLTWDNVAQLAPSTARALGVENGTIVKLKRGGRELEIAAYVMPGHAPGAVTVTLGYGRTAAGGVGGSVDADVAPVGFDTYRLRTSDAMDVAGGVTVEPTGRAFDLAMVQDHHMMDTIGMEGREERIDLLVREGTEETFRKDPAFAHAHEHGPELKSLFDEYVFKAPHQWGMAIDLSKCTGCNACVIACQAENNIPIVGKERVLMNREMHWIRIDRYFAGDVDDPAVVSQPVPCMQCENAPCEQVCPVAATVHSDEGLNDMTYNRCVGVRYCSNNCPYKVRRFNFFNYHLDLNEPQNEVLKMVYNPEVTVRARGVMEKCTYCVQRIQNVKFTAKNERREIADGEIVTACAQSCPSRAITFGNLRDEGSVVRKDHENPRAYGMLEFLNTQPRTRYLARVTNPNPALVKARAQGSAH